MTLPLISRGGEYFRIADPDWPEPLDASYALARGGRWNPPGSFPVLYLNAEMGTARANVDRRFEGLPYSVLDLLPDRRPMVVSADVPAQDFVDIVTDRGCEAAGLPKSYPRHANGREVSHGRCRPIGAEAHEQGLSGIASRSAARSNGEELAWFTDLPVPPVRRWAFDDWYWAKPLGK